MGFLLNVNSIIRQDLTEPLQVGQEYPFSKDGLVVAADDIQIWLTKKDWTALAEIQVVSQTRSNNKTVGRFVIKHVYEGVEQRLMTDVFRRMYGWQ